MTDIAGHDVLTFQREGLDSALAELAEHWDGGPFAERARLLLAEHAADVLRGLATLDRLADAVVRSAVPSVITHGEPHAKNVMLTEQGAALIDWDTALIGPPERDLWMITAPGHARPEELAAGRGLERCTELTGYVPDEDALALYRLLCDLAEIAIYVSDVRRPQSDTADMRVAWRGLNQFVRLADRWGSQLDR